MPYPDGSEVERYNLIGESCDFKAIGKYAGDEVSLHPFLNGPGQNLCVKTTIGPYLLFDGQELAWFDEKGKEVKAWKASSGEKGVVDSSKINGPVPNGKWAVLQNECLSDKIGIRPFTTTDAKQRNGLAINGIKQPGQVAGITIFDKIGELIEVFKKVGDEVVLVVEGESSSPSKPKWIEIAEKEIGQTEIPGIKHNPRIIEYHSKTTLKASTDEVAWCSAFANWVMEKAGIIGTQNARALSWKSWGKRIDKAVYGCLAVFDYGGGKGHVGFVVGKKDDRLLVLGGNQGDKVQITKFKTGKIVAFVAPPEYNPQKTELHNSDGEFMESDFSSTR
jgi:uncharacterized protein (TIGR02594 family)